MTQQPWFELVGGRCNAGMVTVRLRYEGPEPIDDGTVAVTGEHVTDVAALGMVFDDTEAELGNLRRGDPIVIFLRTDGTAGPLAAVLDVRANGKIVRRLVVDAPGFGSEPLVSEHPAP